MKKLKSCSEIDREMRDREIGFYVYCSGSPSEVGYNIRCTRDSYGLSPAKRFARQVGREILAEELKDYKWAWEEVEEVEKKKEVAGVDFVYGLDVVEAPSSALCAGCCFWEKSDHNWVCVKKGRVCETGDNGVYVLVKIPKKRPHVKGMAAIGAWIEERGLVVSSAGPLVFWSDEHGHYNMKNIFAYAGKEIPGDDFIPEEFADLIEYK